MWYEKNIFLTIQRQYLGMDTGLQFAESQTPAEAAKDGNYSTASRPPEHLHPAALCNSWLESVCVCV